MKRHRAEVRLVTYVTEDERERLELAAPGSLSRFLRDAALDRAAQMLEGEPAELLFRRIGRDLSRVERLMGGDPP